MKHIALLMMIVLSLGTISYAEEEELQLYAQSAVLMDADSGRILYAKDGETAMANASTTKILTCILALEYGVLDEVAIASSEAQSQPAVHMGVMVGEEYYLEDLLYALMLESYNDSAVIIAEHISGSVEAFAELMNEKAAEIGCVDSYFITPNGLDGEDENGFHHTTASDLALIMRYCLMESPSSSEFLEITQTASYYFESVDGQRSYSCTNHNTLLTTMSDAISGKTGYTNDAGYCYVGAIENDGRTFIIALLACGWPSNRTYKWSDAEVLFTYGKTNYAYETIETSEYEEQWDTGLLQNLLVNYGKTTEDEIRTDLTIIPSDAVTVLKRTDELIEIEWNVPESLYAPVEADTLVGSVSYLLDGEIIKVDSVKTIEDIEEETTKWRIYKTIFMKFV